MKAKGVNLGGWLVLEKWMDTSLFNETEARDEFDFCTMLSEKEKVKRYSFHRQTFINESDFKYLANSSVNTVRIPVPYFIFGDCPPFLGCIEYLDNAFIWGRKYGINILIDLHTVKGSQNGFDNGGICGICVWEKHPEDVAFALNVLERLALRYKDESNLYGIEILNEPISKKIWDIIDVQTIYPPRDKELAKLSEPVSQKFLEDFYIKAYKILRKHLPDKVKIIMHDHFDTSLWENFFKNNQFTNVVFDTHLYLRSMSKLKVSKPLEYYLDTAIDEFSNMLIQLNKHVPIIIGEWSLSAYINNINTMSDQEKKVIYKQLADKQLELWQQYEGCFFWSYKLLTDNAPWNFKTCNDLGWLSYK